MRKLFKTMLQYTVNLVVNFPKYLRGSFDDAVSAIKLQEAHKVLEDKSQVLEIKIINCEAVAKENAKQMEENEKQKKELDERSNNLDLEVQRREKLHMERWKKEFDEKYSSIQQKITILQKTAINLEDAIASKREKFSVESSILESKQQRLVLACAAHQHNLLNLESEFNSTINRKIMESTAGLALKMVGANCQQMLAIQQETHQQNVELMAREHEQMVSHISNFSNNVLSLQAQSEQCTLEHLSEFSHNFLEMQAQSEERTLGCLSDLSHSQHEQQRKITSNFLQMHTQSEERTLDLITDLYQSQSQQNSQIIANLQSAQQRSHMTIYYDEMHRNEGIRNRRNVNDLSLLADDEPNNLNRSQNYL